jgi:AraC family transcriptional regulator of adaptative response / DNA-3-methyladenine glycosylase II
MNLDPDMCYRTVLSRDRRFDGWFYVAVSSTGIYCRVVCPVRPPKRENCSYFPTTAAAEKAGFRPCLRCRPELAPGNGLLDVSSRLAHAAATLITEGFLNDANLADLANRVGVTERHLRRIFAAAYGVSMIEFAQTQRLLLAKRLLTDTTLPLAMVASTAGFGSVRRFNDLFVSRYGLNPLRLRKASGTSVSDHLRFMLGYRPPFSWPGVMAFLSRRAISSVEHVDDEVYSRAVELKSGAGKVVAWISVKHVPQRHAIEVTVPLALAPVIGQVLGRVSRLFDLNARPDLIDAQLGALAADMPGMRVPGAFDGFEIAVRAMVGQQISVPNARLVLARIAARFGTKIVDAPGNITTTFPLAEALAALPASSLSDLGITVARAQALIELAKEVGSGRVLLEPMAPLDATLAALRRIRGVGESTVQTIAMRALAWPNAFPEGDAVLKRQLNQPGPSALRQHATRWEPWRAYATLHIWRHSEEHYS